MFLAVRSLLRLTNAPEYGLLKPAIRGLTRHGVPPSNRCYELLLVSSGSVVHVLLLQILQILLSQGLGLLRVPTAFVG